MQASFLSVSRAAQPEQRREGVERADNIPVFQWPVHPPCPRHRPVDNHPQSPPIPNTRLRENASGYFQHSRADPCCSRRHSRSKKRSINCRAIHGIGTDEAQFEADFAKNEDDYRADIPPAVPYYGLERAIHLLESVDLADHGFGLFPSSDLSEIIKLLVKGPVEHSIYDTSMSKSRAALARRCVRSLRIPDDSIDIPFLGLSKWQPESSAYDNFPPALRLYYEDLAESVAASGPGVCRYFGLPIFPEIYLVTECLKGRSYRRIEPPEKHMTRQNFQHHNGMEERSIQIVLQDMVSEVSNQPPPNEAELLDILIDYSNLWSRRKVAAWKESFGRSKEWRSCRFVKANKKHLTGKFFIRKDWPAKISWKHSPPAVPINMLRRDTSFRPRFQTRPPRVATSTLRYLVHEEFWGTYNSDIDDGR